MFWTIFFALYYNFMLSRKRIFKQRHSHMKNSILLFFLIFSTSSYLKKQPKNSFVIDVELVTTNQVQKISIANREAIKERLKDSGINITVEILTNTTARIELQTDATQEYIESLLVQPGHIAFYEVTPLTTIAPPITTIYKDTLNFEKFKESFAVQQSEYPGPIGRAEIKDTALVNRTFKNALIKDYLQENDLNIIFKWGVPEQFNSKLALYALKTDTRGNPAMYDHFIDEASLQFTQMATPAIGLKMTKKPARDWEELTRRSAQDNFPIAIVVDDQIYSAPRAMQVISGGLSEISGDFTVEFAQALAQILSSNPIPQLKIKNFSKAPPKKE